MHDYGFSIRWWRVLFSSPSPKGPSREFPLGVYAGTYGHYKSTVLITKPQIDFDWDLIPLPNLLEHFQPLLSQGY